MALWLPPEARAAIEAQPLHALADQLMAVDERLRLIRWEYPDTEDGLRHGWFFIVRFNDDGSLAAWMVHNDNEWCEPTQAHIEIFRRGDSWVNSDEFRKRAAREKYERDMKASRAREEARWNLKDKSDFLFRVQVPVSKDVKAA